MSAKVYVGNLSWSTNDDTLREAFGQYGNVLDSIVMRDRETGRSRGFGFVTFSSQGEADGAIQSLNETELDGRRIKVNLANARTTTNHFTGGHQGSQGGYPPPGGGGGGYNNNNNNYDQRYGYQPPSSYGGGYNPQGGAQPSGYGGGGQQGYTPNQTYGGQTNYGTPGGPEYPTQPYGGGGAPYGGGYTQGGGGGY